MPSSTDTRTFPVLPLPEGVVLPPMVVTIALESDDARHAFEAAEDDELLLVPRIDGDLARVGAVARVESSGTLPGGTTALVVRATGRRVTGSPARCGCRGTAPPRRPWTAR